MRIKIGEVWHDSDHEPICIQVNALEQGQIGGMAHTLDTEGKYAVFPDTFAGESQDMLKWMGG